MGRGSAAARAASIGWTAVVERLETQRLVLRRPTHRDLDAFRLVMDDPERELALTLAHWRREGFGHWLVEEDGRFAGVLEVHRAGEGIGGIEPDEVELGWTVVEALRGRGIATEAARAAAVDAFERAGVPRLVAYIRPENAASIRVAEKLGMRHEADGLTRSGDPMLIFRLRP
jgi:RimJ/RimL family protein N-acetyltransferase